MVRYLFGLLAFVALAATPAPACDYGFYGGGYGFERQVFFQQPVFFDDGGWGGGWGQPIFVRDGGWDRGGWGGRSFSHDFPTRFQHDVSGQVVVLNGKLSRRMIRRGGGGFGGGGGNVNVRAPFTRVGVGW